MTTNSRLQHISSFGRRQNRYGVKSFGSLTPDGYRSVIRVDGTISIRVNTAVYYTFVDPTLSQWKPGDTVDHIESGVEMRQHDHHWRLRRATRSEQALNREMKDGFGSAHAIGLVQVREWTGLKKLPHNQWTGGVASEWDKSLVWDGMSKAAKNHGHDGGKVSKWLNDGKPHLCKSTGRFWEYRLLKTPLESVFATEKWIEPEVGSDTATWWPPGLKLSDMGRYRWDNGPPRMPPKSGAYRCIGISGSNWRYHELAGWLLFGSRPSDNHTVDHNSKVLDRDGCFDNSFVNLLGWADRKQQAATKRAPSFVESKGKPVSVMTKATQEIKEFSDLSTACRDLGVAKETMRDWILKKYQSPLYEVWYTEQKDLVYVHARFAGGKLTLSTEVERWEKLNADDWKDGGKFFKVLQGQPKRKNLRDEHPVRKKPHLQRVAH